METLFESTTLQVLHEARGSATTWVTFGAAEAGVGAPFAKGFLESRGENAVYVMLKQDHWYQVPDIWPALAAIQPVLTRRIITYGSSMGGFGALAFAKELRADQVIAAAPQVSIHPDIVPFDTRWHCHARPCPRPDARAGMQGHVTVIYDPLHRLDRLNAEMIPAELYVPTPLASHNVLEPMRRAGILKHFVSAVASKDVKNALFISRQRRESKYWRRLALGLWAAERKSHHRALKHFVTATLEAPDFDWGYECVANTLWSLREFVDAIEFDNVTIRIRPNNAAHWIRLGLRLVQVNRPQQALSTFEHAVALHPHIPEIWNGLSIAHRHLGDHERSRELLIYAIKIGPRFRHWLYDLSLLDKGLQIPKEQTSRELSLQLECAALPLARRTPWRASTSRDPVVDDLASVYGSSGGVQNEGVEVY